MMYEQAAKSRSEVTRNFIIKVYGWMTLALIITGITGISTASSPLMLSLIFSSQFTFIGLIIAELALVIYLSRKVYSMRAGTAVFWFVTYAVLNGITLSSIFLVFELGVIGYAFLLTAVLFAVMSLYGYVTKTDLTAVGNLLVMGLFGVIIATLFNMFFQNEQLSLWLTYAGVFIFIGLIGYDTQKIKSLSLTGHDGTDLSTNASILGAVILYLDFINLFLRLLRLLNRK